MSDVIWNSFKVSATEVEWEPASYNVKWEGGREYGRWRRVLRKHSHGLTVPGQEHSCSTPPARSTAAFPAI
jgi:hypothetical protein